MSRVVLQLDWHPVGQARHAPKLERPSRHSKRPGQPVVHRHCPAQSAWPESSRSFIPPDRTAGIRLTSHIKLHPNGKPYLIPHSAHRTALHSPHHCRYRIWLSRHMPAPCHTNARTWRTRLGSFAAHLVDSSAPHLAHLMASSRSINNDLCQCGFILDNEDYVAQVDGDGDPNMQPTPTSATPLPSEGALR
jgi:hypothetical protein